MADLQGDDAIDWFKDIVDRLEHENGERIVLQLPKAKKLVAEIEQLQSKAGLAKVQT